MIFNISEEDKIIKEYESHFERLNKESPNRYIKNYFFTPISIKTSEDYYPKICDIFKKYRKYIKSKPALMRVDGLYDKVEKITDAILCSYRLEKSGSHNEARDKIKNIIKENIDSAFFVSDLDSSYSFRAIAPFQDMRTQGIDYSEQNSYPLSFFRIRQVKNEDSKKEWNRTDLLHPPFNIVKKINSERFGLNGVPCLYLGTTTYCCYNELGNKVPFYVSAYRPNNKGKKYKILNLTINTNTINGFDYNPYKPMSQIVQEMWVLYPLVMATSVINPDKNKNETQNDVNANNINMTLERPEYIISRLVMECLDELDIDGVAYLSTRINDPFRFPYSVNLAIPAYKKLEGTEYGEICTGFDMTDPILVGDRDFEHWKFNSNEEAIHFRSYLNAIYAGHHDEFHATIESDSANGSVPNRRVYYDSTPFSVLDDILVGKKFDLALKNGN